MDNEFTNALFEAQRDWDRDEVIYIDPKIQSDVVIATKLRLALELSSGSILVKQTRYPIAGEKITYDSLIKNGEI